MNRTLHTMPQVLRAALAARGAIIGSRELSKGVSELLPALVERAGESNSRLKDAALEAVRQLAALPEAGLKHMTAAIVKCAPGPPPIESYSYKLCGVSSPFPLLV